MKTVSELWIYFLTACCAVITLLIMAKARHNQNVKASVHLKRILIYQVLFKIYVVLCISFVAYYRYFAELGRLQTKSRKKRR